MIRRTVLTAILLSLGLAGAAAAQSYQDSVVRQLREQGWRVTEVDRTLLGRVRIEAVSDSRGREIVLNPRSGVILRDYVYRLNGTIGGLGDLFRGLFSGEGDATLPQRPRQGGDRDGGGGGGGGGSDDDGDDDD